MSQYTPGPWKAGRADMATLVDGVESKWIYAGDKYVAVASGLAADNWDEVMANAALIAASPDLLEAAKLALNELSYSAENAAWAKDELALRKIHGAVMALRAAIAKAEGRS